VEKTQQQKNTGEKHSRLTNGQGKKETRLKREKRAASGSYDEPEVAAEHPQAHSLVGHR